MARATPKEPPPKAPGVLPVAPEWAAFHAQTLRPFFETWQEQKRVAPVILLVGPEGAGKREMAYLIAQWVNCEASGLGEPAAGPDLFGGGAAAVSAAPRSAKPGEPCGTCTSCQK